MENNLKKNIYKETHKQLNHSTIHLKLTQHCKIKYTSKNGHKNKSYWSLSRNMWSNTAEIPNKCNKKEMLFILSLLAFFEGIETHFRSDLTSFLLCLFSDQSSKDIFRFVLDLHIWKFSVVLKLSLKDFEHYLASKWDEHNCMIGWTFFGIAFLLDWN